MHPFFEAVSAAGGIALAIVAAIVVLTLFYRVLAWMSTAETKPETMAVRGVLKKDTQASVDLNGGLKFERVRFLGFTNSETMKTRLPFELNGMVILEDENKTKLLVRAKDIRMIIVPHVPAPENRSGTTAQME